MSNTAKLTDYIGRGVHADRPASPLIATDALALYYETDTGDTFAWSGSAWVQINGATGGSVSTATESTQASIGTATQILASDSSRIGARVYNKSASPLYLGTDASTTPSLFTTVVSPGESWEVTGYTGELWAIWETVDSSGQANIVAFPA